MANDGLGYEIKFNPLSNDNRQETLKHPCREFTKLATAPVVMVSAGIGGLFGAYIAQARTGSVRSNKYGNSSEARVFKAQIMTDSGYNGFGRGAAIAGGIIQQVLLTPPKVADIPVHIARKLGKNLNKYWKEHHQSELHENNSQQNIR